jgi:glucosamine 6-phosphate synthetase-like amidotransferase/phosphosugar isomerase protein
MSLITTQFQHFNEHPIILEGVDTALKQTISITLQNLFQVYKNFNLTNINSETVNILKIVSGILLFGLSKDADVFYLDSISRDTQKELFLELIRKTQGLDKVSLLHIEDPGYQYGKNGQSFKSNILSIIEVANGICNYENKDIFLKRLSKVTYVCVNDLIEKIYEITSTKYIEMNENPQFISDVIQGVFDYYTKCKNNDILLKKWIYWKDKYIQNGFHSNYQELKKEWNSKGVFFTDSDVKLIIEEKIENNEYILKNYSDYFELDFSMY